MRLFRPRFVLENVGKTAVSDLTINVQMRLPPGGWQQAFASHTAISLAGSQSANFSFDFSLPLETELPDQINFQLGLRFHDVHGKTVNKQVIASWNTNDNSWFYGINPGQS